MSKYKYHGIYDITFYKCDEDGNQETNEDGSIKLYTSKQNVDLSYVSDWFELEDLTDYHEQIDNTNTIHDLLCDMYDIQRQVKQANLYDKPKDNDGSCITVGDCIENVIDQLNEFKKIKERRD